MKIKKIICSFLSAIMLMSLISNIAYAENEGESVHLTNVHYSLSNAMRNALSNGQNGRSGHLVALNDTDDNNNATNNVRRILFSCAAGVDMMDDYYIDMFFEKPVKVDYLSMWASKQQKGNQEPTVVRIDYLDQDTHQWNTINRKYSVAYDDGEINKAWSSSAEHHAVIENIPLNMSEATSAIRVYILDAKRVWGSFGLFKLAPYGTVSSENAQDKKNLLTTENVIVSTPGQTTDNLEYLYDNDFSTRIAPATKSAAVNETLTLETPYVFEFDFEDTYRIDSMQMVNWYDALSGVVEADVQYYNEARGEWITGETLSFSRYNFNIEGTDNNNASFDFVNFKNAMTAKKFRLVVKKVKAYKSMFSIYELALYGKKIEADTPDFKIALLSDTHVNANDQGWWYGKGSILKSEIASIISDNTDLDAFVFGGDIVYQGNKNVLYESAYTEIQPALAELPAELKTFAVVGNHEYPLETYEEPYVSGALDLFTKYFKKSGSYTDVIGGYHFITQTAQNYWQDKYNEGYIKAKIEQAIAENPSKPVFLVVHKPILNHKLDGFGQANETCWSGDFVAWLRTKPQVISIVGDWHQPVQSSRSIIQDGFTEIVLPAGQGSFAPTGLSEITQYQAIVMEAKDNVFTFNKLVYTGGESGVMKPMVYSEPWIVNMNNMIDGTGVDYPVSRKDTVAAPTFAEGAANSITFSQSSSTSVSVTFPAADRGEDAVMSYRTDAVDSSGNVVAQSGWIDTTYFNDAAPEESITRTVEGLNTGSEYTFKIYARNTLGTESKALEVKYTPVKLSEPLNAVYSQSAAMKAIMSTTQRYASLAWLGDGVGTDSQFALWSITDKSSVDFGKKEHYIDITLTEPAKVSSLDMWSLSDWFATNQAITKITVDYLDATDNTWKNVLDKYNVTGYSTVGSIKEKRIPLNIQVPVSMLRVYIDDVALTSGTSGSFRCDEMRINGITIEDKISSNLLYSATVTAGEADTSKLYDGKHGSENAFEIAADTVAVGGDTTLAEPYTITVDFGKVYSVDSLRMISSNAGNSGIEVMTIKYNRDGEWITAGSYTFDRTSNTYHLSNADCDELAFAENEIVSDKIKIEIDKARRVNGLIAIDELEIYGEAYEYDVIVKSEKLESGEFAVVADVINEVEAFDIYVAAFSGNKLISVEMIKSPTSRVEYKFSLDTKGADLVKAFAWTTQMKPVAKVTTIDLK